MWNPFVVGLGSGELNGRQLERVVLELLGIEYRFLSSVRIKDCLGGGWRVCLVGLAESPVPRSRWS